MNSEKKLQAEVLKFFRDRGAFAIKTRPGMGTPRGTPDVLALYGAVHAEVECKASPSAPYQPGQKACLDFLRRNGRHPNRFVYRVDPTNWPEVRAELERDFF